MDLGQYGLFQEDGKGPVWRAFFKDVEEAKAEGKRLSETEQSVFFVYSFANYSEVIRFKPAKKK